MIALLRDINLFRSFRRKAPLRLEDLPKRKLLNKSQYFEKLLRLAFEGVDEEEIRHMLSLSRRGCSQAYNPYARMRRDWLKGRTCFEEMNY